MIGNINIDIIPKKFIIAIAITTSSFLLFKIFDELAIAAVPHILLPNPINKESLLFNPINLPINKHAATDTNIINKINDKTLKSINSKC